jgi:hypothetical protein
VDKLISFGSILFGRGDDDFPLWLLTIRVNILLLLAAWVVVVAWQLSRAPWKRIARAWPDVGIALGVTCVAAAFRWAVIRSNLFDHGASTAGDCSNGSVTPRRSPGV